MANTYAIGQKVRITGTFTLGGAATDPTTITLKIQSPAGVDTSYTYALGEVTKSAVGVYYRDVSITESGQYYYKWLGTGAVEAADEFFFYVEQSQF